MNKKENLKSWIPISDGLPIDESLVLVRASNGFFDLGVYVRNEKYQPQLIGWHTHILNNCEITHWMEIPAVPKQVKIDK